MRIPLLLGTTLAVAALAQQPKAPATQLNEMKKVSFLVGNWKGSGTIEMSPGQRRTFSQTERVEPKLGGLLLTIEGEGKSETGALAHQAFAVISCDGNGALHFRAYDQFGRVVDADATVSGNTFVWSMHAGPQQMRYTIHVNAQGQWNETGDMTADGTTWHKFFEMVLDRVK
jgi:hypothetical protein